MSNVPLISSSPISPAMLRGLEDKDMMVIDAIVPRLSSEMPSAIGDGFRVDAVPFSRWDTDTSKASQRHGARFARYAFNNKLLLSYIKHHSVFLCVHSRAF